MSMTKREVERAAARLMVNGPVRTKRELAELWPEREPATQQAHKRSARVFGNRHQRRALAAKIRKAQRKESKTT